MADGLEFNGILSVAKGIVLTGNVVEELFIALLAGWIRKKLGVDSELFRDLGFYIF
jgi:hypothetical protein